MFRFRYKRKIVGVLIIIVFIFLLLFGIRIAKKIKIQITAYSVPGEYKELYGFLDNDLNSFIQKVDSSWDKSKKPVVFSAGLISANPNYGETLLKPETFENSIEYLDRLQELGVKGVAIDINFPLLDPQFHKDPATYSKYLDFYKKLFSEIRKRKMVVGVEIQPIFPDFSTLQVRPYYQSLTFDQYKQRVLEMSKIVALELQPEYLTVGNEPDTAAKNSGQPLHILDNYIQEVEFLVSGLEQAGLAKNTKLGAGFGTWYKDYKAATERIAQIKGIDFINIHIYAVDAGLLDRALEIADIAGKYNKPLAIHESWLYKWKLGENRGQGILGAGKIYGRDIFSFWQPLDKKFVEALYKLGNYKDMEYVSFFWSQYFFGYMDYEQGTKIQESRRMNQGTVNGVQAALEGKISETGSYYKKLLSE